MNKQAEVKFSILVIAIGLIVGLVLYTAITGIVGSATTTAVASNATVGMSAAGVGLNLRGPAVVGDIIVTNGSNGTIIPATNYTVANNQVVNGILVATLTPKATTPMAGSSDINLSYEYQPDGYISSSGGRAMASLILILSALALIVYALTGTSDGLKGLTGRG